MYIGTKEQAMFVLKSLQAQLDGEMTYDEAFECYKQVVGFIEDCGVFDPATEYLLRKKHQMASYMDALNVANDLQRVEHLDFHKVIIVGRKTGEIDEVQVGVPNQHAQIANMFGSKEKYLQGTVKLYATRSYVAKGLTKLDPREDISEITYA